MTTASSESLGAFITKLIEEKGLEGLDPDVLVQVRLDLESRLENRINATILANLPEEDLTEFSQLIDTADEAKIQAYMKKRIPDLDNVIAVELLGFRQTYLGS